MKKDSTFFILLFFILLLLGLNYWAYKFNNRKKEQNISSLVPHWAKENKPKKEAEIKQNLISNSVNKSEIESIADGQLEDLMKQKGLVGIGEIDHSIKVKIRYSSTNNFLEQNMYGDLNEAYLQKEVALKLSKAQEYLKEEYPDLTLLVWDAARPLIAQKNMWNAVKGTTKQQYVAAPSSGSLHCFGAAVDLTIAKENGDLLDMATDLDFFGELAQPRLEAELLRQGKISSKQIKNRQLLRSVMKKAGFKTIQREWWHFEAYRIAEVKNKYQIIE